MESGILSGGLGHPLERRWGIVGRCCFCGIVFKAARRGACDGGLETKATKTATSLLRPSRRAAAVDPRITGRPGIWAKPWRAAASGRRRNGGGAAFLEGWVGSGRARRRGR